MGSPAPEARRTAGESSPAVFLNHRNDYDGEIDLRMAVRRKWWRRTGSKKSGFYYVDADGAIIRDRDHVARIRRLAIPPAWADVRINPRARGPVQAIGIDSLDRLQYTHHP